MHKKSLKQFFCFGLMILNRGNRSRYRSHIPRAHLFRPLLNGQRHSFPVRLLHRPNAFSYYFLPSSWRAITNF
jgi:hypothetical protein